MFNFAETLRGFRTMIIMAIMGAMGLYFAFQPEQQAPTEDEVTVIVDQVISLVEQFGMVITAVIGFAMRVFTKTPVGQGEQ